MQSSRDVEFLFNLLGESPNICIGKKYAPGTLLILEEWETCRTDLSWASNQAWPVEKTRIELFWSQAQLAAATSTAGSQIYEWEIDANGYMLWDFVLIQVQDIFYSDSELMK